MKLANGISSHAFSGTLGLLASFLVTASGSIPAAYALDVFKVPADFAMIQEAVNAAAPGDIVQVAPGVYSEAVIITTDGIRLRGDNAVLDGTGLGDVGIAALNTSNVEISGFTVEFFEVGIALIGATNSQVRDNELRENFSDDPTLRDGIQLVAAHENIVVGNSAHGNGHNGITLKGSSSHNTILDNDSNDNGTQVTANTGGCGIQLIGDGNNGNLIAENNVKGNGWGIQISAASADNVIVDNASHANERAGIATLGASNGNFIAENNAAGNGLANINPSFQFDLFDANLGNIFEDNIGRSNF